LVEMMSLRMGKEMTRRKSGSDVDSFLECTPCVRQ